MKIIRPLLIFIFIFSMSLTLYGQKVAGSSSDNDKNAEVTLKVEDETDFVEIYPNPATEYLNINVKDSKLKDVSFELYDIIGNKIEVQAQELNADKFRIPVEKLHLGYYVLIVSDVPTRYKKAFKFSKK